MGFGKRAVIDQRNFITFLSVGLLSGGFYQIQLTFYAAETAHHKQGRLNPARVY